VIAVPTKTLPALATESTIVTAAPAVNGGRWAVDATCGAAVIPDSGALQWRVDVVVHTHRGQESVVAPLVNTDAGLGRQVVPAPADAVVLHGATHTVVGHGALLEVDATSRAEALIDEGAESSALPRSV
jgi:hypothetical protein